VSVSWTFADFPKQWFLRKHIPVGSKVLLYCVWMVVFLFNIAEQWLMTLFFLKIFIKHRWNYLARNSGYHSENTNLGIKYRVLFMLGKCSTSKLCTQPWTLKSRYLYETILKTVVAMQDSYTIKIVFACLKSRSK
jgi:hypothetical protein